MSRSSSPDDSEREEQLYLRAERDALKKPTHHFKLLAERIEVERLAANVIVAKAKSELQRRAARERYLPEEFRSDYAWLILLDLFVSDHETRPVPLASAADRWKLSRFTCARYLAALIEAQFVTRVFDEFGSGPVVLQLTELGRLRVRCVLSAYD